MITCVVYPVFALLPVIVIPSYNPDHRLQALVAALLQHDYPVVVVNDGSTAAGALPVLQMLRAAAQNRLRVVDVPVNRGKGCALKTGFRYVAQAWPGAGVVTADGDGQHTIPDILRLARELSLQPQHFLLGERQPGDSLPWKSRIGNGLTRFVFRQLFAIPIRDTQSGLRAIPAALLRELQLLKGDRYDYETGMLLHLALRKFSIRSVPVETIYIEANGGSHFRPVIDSCRVYRLIALYFFKRIRMGCAALLPSSLKKGSPTLLPRK